MKTCLHVCQEQTMDIKKKKNNNIPTTKPNPSHLFLIKETKAVEHMLLHTLKLIGGSI